MEAMTIEEIFKPALTVNFEANGKKYVNFVLNSETAKQLKKQGIQVEAIARKKQKENLCQFTDRYFYGKAELRGGYLNMGEITYDAQNGDPDAQFLLKLYDAIWEKEDELEKQIDQMSLEELLNLDIDSFARQAYDTVVAELEKVENEG